MRKHLSTIILVIIFGIGLSLLLYPTVSDYWNSIHQSRMIASYMDDVAQMDDDQYGTILDEARAYNETLLNKSVRWYMDEDETAAYNELLDISGSGVMGYIEIPTINVSLPIYHGVDESTLQVGVGHIQGSSLPVGGESTHAALSGHRGLPSATLFTDLDRLKEGDIFMIHVLDETLYYEVDQIHIVEPDDMTYLEIEEGEDLCTLVTCTPYGVNSHRLLVRGHRTEAVETEIELAVTADARQVDPMTVTPVVTAVLLVLLGIALLMGRRRARRRKKKLEELEALKALKKNDEGEGLD